MTAHYIVSDGRWAERDPLGIEAGENLYLVEQDSPINDRDPSGEVGLRAKFVMIGKNQSCGKFVYEAKWELSSRAPENGWIVQEVFITPDITRCDGTRFTPPPTLIDPSGYWEAWFVRKGSTVPETGKGVHKGVIAVKPGEDNFSWDFTPNTCGNVEWSSIAFFIPGFKMTPDFTPKYAPPAGVLPATNTVPDFGPYFSKIDPDAIVSRRVSIWWTCCPRCSDGTASKSKLTHYEIYDGSGEDNVRRG